MARSKARYLKTLADQYPPSEPCGCEVCLGYCARPGWWTVAETARAIEAGYGGRMMLEVAPERTFGVLAPAFKGCEGGFALRRYAKRGCTFLRDGLCELHGTGFQPLECRFCHHDRTGLGLHCHTDLEKDWHTPEGQALVDDWAQARGLLPSSWKIFTAPLPLHGSRAPTENTPKNQKTKRR